MVPSVVSHYKILGKLGVGGMGVVYKAEDITLKRLVALKFLTPLLSTDSEAKERFFREARAASSLQHTNICTIHEVGETDDGQMFIVMDYYEGETLSTRIERGPLAVAEAIRIALEVAAGLARAHERGIIHRDIKPANIILTNDGIAKIVDFGLAKLDDQTRVTQAGATLGTTAYMSPEQIRGHDADQQSDIWSLGVVLYEMLSGLLPFEGHIAEAIFYSILNQEPVSLRKLKPDVPEEVERTVSKALQKARESRYGSMAEFSSDLARWQNVGRAQGAERPPHQQVLRALKKPAILVPVIIVLFGLGTGAIWLVHRWQKQQWAREEALPEIARLRDQDQYTPALDLLMKAEQYIPEDPQLRNLATKVSRQFTVETTPGGARVFIMDYPGTEAGWKLVGTTPIRNARISQSFMRWRITKDGLDPREGTDNEVGSSWQGLPVTLTITLDTKGTTPPEMVKVPGKGKIGDFLIDRYEVTNKQYKAFVDSGGYRRREFWKQPFERNGSTLAWERAITEFVDATGRPGPATWELGSYPKGHEEYPVRGVSWYEAAAFAEFVGKALPTRSHWRIAAGIDNVTLIVPHSNFGSTGPAAVGSYQGIGPYGTYDMAGNVKEWCWNASGPDRAIRGGAWDDPQYMFTESERRPAAFRGENCGFRCARYLPQYPVPEVAFGADVVRAPIDFREKKPCSDGIFSIYGNLYSYTKTDLAPALESRDDMNPDWTQENVSVNTAYGNERMGIYLYLPKHGAPPYQTVVYCPGTAASSLSSIKDYWTLEAEICTKSGRAFVVPVYKGTFERRVHDGSGTPQDFRDRIIMMSKDLGRTIDYLETRPEFDTKKLAFNGLSSGALQGLIFSAVEKRLKLAILVSGGLESWGMPEIDPVNFAPRVTIPVLMMNGIYDHAFPVELNQNAAFKLLGTGEKDKVHLLYKTGHDVWSTRKFIKDYVDFLDSHFGAAY